MAISKLMTDKKGRKYHRIWAYCHGERYSTRWDVPEGLSAPVIQKRLNKAEADFITACENGNVQKRKEKREAKEAAEAEAKKVLTFKQFAESVYLPMIRTKNKRLTVAGYESALKNHIYPSLGNLKINEIRVAEINKLLNSMYENKSYNTRKLAYSVLHACFAYAVSNDVITVNPVDKVEKPKMTDSERKEKLETEFAYSAETVAGILEKIKQEPMMWRTIITMIANTGMRRAEVCGLRWQSIDFEKKTITIDNNIVDIPQMGLIDQTPKNGEMRTIPVDDYTIQLMSDWQFHQKEIGNRSIYCFTQKNSVEPINPACITQKFAILGKKYGIKDFHPHKLRHSFASILEVNGVSPTTIAKLLGDNVVTVMRTYVHTDSESVKLGAETFQAAINKHNKKVKEA